MMDFTFEAPAWELALLRCPEGGDLSAAHFLTMMEQEDELSWEDALRLLEDRDILLNVAQLPAGVSSGEMAIRLRREFALVRDGMHYETLDENDPLRLYLQELAGIPSCGDPNVLAERCKHGDTAARDQLMNGMLHLVIDQACRYAGHSVLLLDLMQEGAVGLWQALVEYAGGDLESQCRRAIDRAMAREIVSQARANGVGGKMRQSLEDFRSTDERLLMELGRNPTLEEIASALRITVEEAQLLSQMLDAARTIDRAKQASQPKEETPEDSMAVEDTAYFQMRQRIAELLSGLDERDALLITLRYGLEGGLPLSAEETARKLGLTPEEVTEREAAALSKLRNH